VEADFDSDFKAQNSKGQDISHNMQDLTLDNFSKYLSPFIGDFHKCFVLFNLCPQKQFTREMIFDLQLESESGIMPNIEVNNVELI